MEEKTRPNVSDSNATEHSADHGEADLNKQRRRALVAAISAVGVSGATQLPKQWSRPVVDHVLLPAHAQTTTPVSTSEPACLISCTSGIIEDLEVYYDDFLSTHFLARFAVTTYTNCISEPGGDVTSTTISVFDTAFAGYFNLLATETGSFSSYGALTTYPLGTEVNVATEIFLSASTSFNTPCN
ncbi:MAG: hypothetical protein DHS20C01_21750 [marine bacterium B5-7]|nr:MAG: hypothetical protein DHS20C01_21750 [marine bacterium B5-7]